MLRTLSPPSNYLSCLHAIIFSLFAPSPSRWWSRLKGHILLCTLAASQSSLSGCWNLTNELFSCKSMFFVPFCVELKKSKKKSVAGSKWIAPWELRLKGCNFNSRHRQNLFSNNSSYFNALPANCSIAVIKFCAVSIQRSDVRLCLPLHCVSCKYRFRCAMRKRFSLFNVKPGGIRVAGLLKCQCDATISKKQYWDLRVTKITCTRGSTCPLWKALQIDHERIFHFHW